MFPGVVWNDTMLGMIEASEAVFLIHDIDAIVDLRQEEISKLEACFGFGGYDCRCHVESSI
jgi:hypothetical protein